MVHIWLWYMGLVYPYHTEMSFWVYYTSHICIPALLCWCTTSSLDDNNSNNKLTFWSDLIYLMYWDWYYKKKSTICMNLVLNLHSSPLLKPHSLSNIVSIDGNIPGILFYWGGGGGASSWLVTFSWIFSLSCFFQVGFEFWRRKRC